MCAPLVRGFGEPGDLGWVVMAHGELYAAEFGYDRDFEILVAQMVADYSARRDERPAAAWIATIEGERVGCAFVVARNDDTAQLRMVLVQPRARGHGLGRRLVGAGIDFARGAGYARVRLRTNPPMTAARAIYLAAGFRLVQQEPARRFGVDLVEQDYELDLAAARGAGRGEDLRWA